MSASGTPTIAYLMCHKKTKLLNIFECYLVKLLLGFVTTFKTSYTKLAISNLRRKIYGLSYQCSINPHKFRFLFSVR